MKFLIESLGCAKNSVDSRAMATLLLADGYVEVDDAELADVVIVNTCGFIRPARQESLDVLRAFSQSKKVNQFLIAAGCLSERDKEVLGDQVENLDAVIGVRSWPNILDVLKKVREKHQRTYYHFLTEKSKKWMHGDEPLSAVQGGSAYVKIADGCDRNCAFCAIPHIKGPMISRELEMVLRDVENLQEQGVQEIILIAQDTTSYGRDLGLQDGLKELLSKMIKRIPHVPWLRLMYAFPGVISDELIQMIAAEDQILPYLDIPLQHAHPQILRSMLRPHDMDSVRETIEKIRGLLPHLAIRTTFIVGFPGETEAAFQTLADFLEEMRFDRVGFFPYYHEAYTNAFTFGDEVPEEEKEKRIQYLASIQQRISLEKNRAFIGEKMDVLIEGSQNGISVGRSYRDAPEIDGLVIIESDQPIGKIIQAEITDAMPYDLMARASSA